MNRCKVFAMACLCVSAAILARGPLLAQNAKVALAVGDAAPKFESTDDQGKTWKSADHIGKKIVVIYFYPADDTGGCTKQACGFRDDMKKLTDKGVEVIGVSGDSAKNHQIFKAKYKLNFTLLADETGALAKKFGVPTKKGGTVATKDADGNPVELVTGVRAARWTFVIGTDGKILFKNQEVKAPEDSKKVLEVIEKATAK